MSRSMPALVILGLGLILAASATYASTEALRSLVNYVRLTGDRTSLVVNLYLLGAVISLSFVGFGAVAAFAFIRLGWVTRKSKYIALPTRVAVYRMARWTSLGLIIPSVLFVIQGVLLATQTDKGVDGWSSTAGGIALLGFVAVSQVALFAIAKMEGHRIFARL